MDGPRPVAATGCTMWFGLSTAMHWVRAGLFRVNSVFATQLCLYPPSIRLATNLLVSEAPSNQPTDQPPPTGDDTILHKPIEEWPVCECLLSWHSDGFPLARAQAYAALRRPFLVNDLAWQDVLLDRTRVYRTLLAASIPVPTHIIVDRSGLAPGALADAQPAAFLFGGILVVVSRWCKRWLLGNRTGRSCLKCCLRAQHAPALTCGMKDLRLHLSCT